MSSEKKIIAMIPARMGSQRLPRKNIALVAGRPLISFAIEAALDSKIFDRVIVSTDDPSVKEVAGQYDVEIYDRAPENASSDARSDEVVEEFLRNFPCDYLAWVNPTSPLQTGDEIRLAMLYLIENDFQSLFTVYPENVHCVMKDEGINFNSRESFAKTQDLPPVSRFVYSVMAWNSQSFLDTYRKEGHALFCGKTGYFPVSKETAIIVKNENDLKMADALMRFRLENRNYKVSYFGN